MKRLFKPLFFVIYLFSLLLYSQPSHDKKVVGYYAQWAIYARDYNVWDIDASKLTHLNYSFFGINYSSSNPSATTILSLDTYADFEHNEGGHAWDAPYKGNFADLKKLKEQFPHLKILISVGGWTKSHHFPDVCANPIARQALVQSMVDMMQTYTWIDGFDIDWEYPVVGGTDGSELLNGSILPAQPHTNDDHKNFVLLVKDMRQAFPVGKLVTAALGNSVVQVPNQYIGNNNQSAYGLTENLATYCDYVTFFGYDFGGNWNDKTCYNAPLYGSGNIEDPMHSNIPGQVQSLEVLTSKFINEVGIPNNKLIMGLPFYGKLFKNVVNTTSPIPALPGLFLAAPRDNVPSCTSPQAPQGSWDSAQCENSGSIEYCDLAGGVATNGHNYLNPDGTLKASAIAAGWIRYWDDTCKVPYLYNATLNQFISYDDQQSITEKVNFIKGLNLAGGMIWELSQDERTTNALLTTINTAFNNTPVDFTLNFKLPNGSSVSGVEVTLTKVSDGSTEVLTSNASGQVTFNDKIPYTQYNITYTYLGGFYFSPTSIEISQTNNQNKTYNITLSNQVSTLSGSVKDSSNIPITNVTIRLIRTSDNVEVASLNSTDGNFSFLNVLNGIDYTIKAEKLNYIFVDTSVLNVSATVSNLIITGNIATYSISGVIYNGSQPYLGVQVNLSGASTASMTTSNDGVYSFTNLQAGSNYVVTPVLSGQNFQPTNLSVNAISQNVTQNFVVNNYKVSGIVKNGSTPLSGAKVEMTLPWTSSASPYVSLIATTDAEGKYFFDNSVLNGYTQILSIKMNSWDNNGISYFPTSYSSISVPSSPTQFNFNSQPQAIEFEYTNLTNNQTVVISNGNPLVIQSIANMLVSDGTTIDSVVFNINGTNYNGTNVASTNQYNYSWVFDSTLYNQAIPIIATITASNGMTYTETINITMQCSGVGCPNVPPSITWVDPVNTTINQASGFQPVQIKVTATDLDGTISSVTISVNGGLVQNMSLSGGYYVYTLLPNSYSQYNLVLTATDNQNAIKTLNKTLNITNSVFTPLPSGNIILGYAHSWENSSAPFLYFNQMTNKKFNVVAYSFIETVNGDGYTPQLTINSNRYLTAGVFNPQLLKDDINTLKSMGIPVIVSIGGQNGHVELNTVEQKNIFVQGCKSIIDQYGFDGIDLDFEGGSMNFGAGALTNFSYANLTPYPKLKNVVDAFKELKQFYGNGFIMTCAPETFYVQVGYSTYGATAGAFLPVIDNLRNELDLVMVQLYNTGSITALNGQAYPQANPDFLTSMSDMLITGFNVGNTGYHFDGLPASKIMVGIPSCPAAAPAGGYIQPSEAINALDYLRFGTTFTGRSYTLQGSAHPTLRGVMTWSINWDAASGCASADEFGTNYWNYFYNSSISAITWNGSSWSNTVGPNITEDAIINGNFSSSSNGVFSCKTLTVNSGKNFNINTGDSITVADEVVNNGSFIVEDNAYLFQINPSVNSGSILVKKNSSTLKLYDYTLWSSPVANQSLQTFSPETLPSRFYTYNPLTDLFNVVDLQTHPNFSLGIGYLIRTPNTWTPNVPTVFNGLFSGIPNNGNISLTGLIPDKFYAVGNPYPSPININAFYTQNPNVGTLYFWRKTNGASGTTYATATLAGTTTSSGGLTPSDDIAVGQGFILKPGNDFLSFTNSMRISPSTTPQFLRINESKSRIWINLKSSSDILCQAMIGYMPSATNGIDNNFDGRYLNDSTTSLTSIINGEEFAIQARSLPFNSSDIVDLSFKTNIAGNYTISIDHVDGIFDSGQNIFLKDNLSNTITNLTVENYSFFSDAGIFNSRFDIVFEDNTLGAQDFINSPIDVYGKDGIINIISNNIIMQDIRIFDLRGALIFNEKNINKNQVTLKTMPINQVLFIEIVDIIGNKFVKKIII